MASSSNPADDAVYELPNINPDFRDIFDDIDTYPFEPYPGNPNRAGDNGLNAVDTLGDRGPQDGIISDDTLQEFLGSSGTNVPEPGFNEFDRMLAEYNGHGAQQPDLETLVNDFPEPDFGQPGDASELFPELVLSLTSTAHNTFEDFNSDSNNTNVISTAPDPVAQPTNPSFSISSNDLAHQEPAVGKAVPDTDNQTDKASKDPQQSCATDTITKSPVPPAGSSLPTQPVSNEQPTAMASQFSGPKSERVAMDKSDDDEIILRFSSAEEANEWPKRGPVPDDPTIPRTAEGRKTVVKEMIKAMQSVDEAEDNPHMIKPFRERKHPVVRLEVVAWNLLDACTSRHLTGPLLLGHDVKQNKTTSAIPTFKERMDDIIRCLRTHKTICKHLLDPFYLYNFVDDPQGARQRVRSNKTLNKKKTEVMNAGKQALGKESTPKSSGGLKKGGSKSVRFSEEKDLPTPSTTPGRGLDSTGQPATPYLNLNAGPPSEYFSPTQQANPGNMTPGMSSPVYDTNSSMSGSGNNSALSSPVQDSPYSANMFNNMESQNNFPAPIQPGGNAMHNFPAISYPTGRPTHDFSPVRPSRLQNVYQNSPVQEVQQTLPATFQPGAANPNLQPPQLSAVPQVAMSHHSSGLSASRTPFGRGSKRPRTDTEESNPSGSPQKKPRT